MTTNQFNHKGWEVTYWLNSLGNWSFIATRGDETSRGSVFATTENEAEMKIKALLGGE